MKKRWLSLLLALMMIGSCAGCTSKDTPLPASFSPDESERLVIYTSHKQDVWWPIVKEFEERTGIWVDVVTGGTNELLEQIRQEADAPKADLMFGGGVESLNSYASCFEPYLCTDAQALLPSFRSPDDLWTPFSALPVVLIYNTKLVDPTQLTNWDDLLGSDFSGKIAFADPRISGSAFTGLLTCLGALPGSYEENMSRLADRLNGKQLEGSGDVLSAVAEGSCYVGVTLEETAMQWISDGKDLAMVYPTGGTSAVPDGSALIKGAPHRDNGKAFLDFTVSRDVQQLLSDRFYRRPVREDVSPNAALCPLSELSLCGYDTVRASENRDAILNRWSSCLGKEAEP